MRARLLLLIFITVNCWAMIVFLTCVRCACVFVLVAAFVVHGGLMKLKKNVNQEMYRLGVLYVGFETLSWMKYRLRVC